MSQRCVTVESMTCIACRGASTRRLCGPCLRTLRAAPERLVGGVLVRSAFLHAGAARALVVRLKYEAVWGVAQLLGRAMSDLIPGDAEALVPLPRVTTRRHMYGVDPARALADALGAATGIPVVAALRPRVWSVPRAGPADSRRGVPRFTLRAAPPARSVLVDDVVTSGATLQAARAASGLGRAITATVGHSALTSRSTPP